jgi:hypothetical protein
MTRWKLVRALFATLIVGWLDNLFANRKSGIKSVSGIEKLNGKLPIAIYVHYSKLNLLSSREVQLLKTLKSSGLKTCLVVNQSSKHPLSVDQIIQFETISDSLFVRSNIGYDLGAYRDTFFYLQDTKILSGRKVFFMNNSVIWFPDKVKKYVLKVRKANSDVIAASISLEHTRHLQTFFFASVSEKGHKEISAWLSTIKNWRFKKTIVRYGELGTSRFFDKGIEVQGLPSPDQIQDLAFINTHAKSIKGNVRNAIANRDLIRKRLLRNREFAFAGVPMNPTHANWLEMIELGFPGIKIDLLKSNPTGVADYEFLISYIRDAGVSIREINGLIYSNTSKSKEYRIRSKFRF